MDNLEQVVDTQNVQPQTSNKIVVEGVGEFTPEEIKEMKLGYMRQQDYTRKTQELSNHRKQLESNPPQTIVDNTRELEQKIERMYIDMQLKEMKSKYSDFDETEVLSKALDLISDGMSVDKIDFEFIHKGLKGSQQIDENALRQKIIAELQSGVDTSTLIGGKDIPPVNFSDIELPPDEERARIRMGISKEEWIKYK